MYSFEGVIHNLMKICFGAIHKFKIGAIHKFFQNVVGGHPQILKRSLGVLHNFSKIWVPLGSFGFLWVPSKLDFASRVGLNGYSVLLLLLNKKAHKITFLYGKK